VNGCVRRTDKIHLELGWMERLVPSKAGFESAAPQPHGSSAPRFSAAAGVPAVFPAAAPACSLDLWLSPERLIIL